MATSHQRIDRISAVDSAEALSNLTLEKMEMHLTDPSLRTYQDDVTSGIWGSVYPPDHSVFDTKTAHAGGYGNAANAMGEYLSYANTQGKEIASHRFSDSGFERSYALETPHFFSEQDHGELYADDAGHISLVDPSFSQCLNQNTNFASQFHNVHPKLNVNSNGLADCRHVELRQNFRGSARGYGRGNNHYGDPEGMGFLHGGVESLGVYGLEFSIPPHRNNPYFPSMFGTASRKHIDPLEWLGDDFGMALQHGESYNNVHGSSSSFSSNEYPYRGLSEGSFGVRVSGPHLEKRHDEPTFNEGIAGGRCNDLLCSCTHTSYMLNQKNRRTVLGLGMPRGRKSMSSYLDAGLLKQCELETDYRDAKFFVIKSYSEDNVFKSIKYGVWASTSNGNKKLDAAYREAKSKECSCPVFLLFSVNASAQFCGVAEMVGAVDFETSVEYWQQDKWSGHFPVKWHIVKDVPNSQFRHIILRNNDNKPVTNSRDTQEVGLEQGIEMLNIFKNYESRMSIFDDFCYYEERQNDFQRRKAVHRAGLEASTVDLSANLSNHLAETLILDEYLK